jgi:hypothetical protein
MRLSHRRRREDSERWPQFLGLDPRSKPAFSDAGYSKQGTSSFSELTPDFVGVFDFVSAALRFWIFLDVVFNFAVGFAVLLISLFLIPLRFGRGLSRAFRFSL